jgi:RNA polymerase sigma-70 factor (ECF subfamily)
MSLFPLFSRSAGIAKSLGDSRAGLFRLAYMWCHDRALADDLTQEALTKALLHADALRDADKLRPWLFGILVNCWRDHLRARRPTEDIDSIEEHWLATEESCEHSASRAQLAGRVRAAIAQLPVGQREVLALIDLEECSYAEAAQILAIPMGTVMSRLCRGRASLRGLLADTQAGVQAHGPGLRSVK